MTTGEDDLSFYILQRCNFDMGTMADAAHKIVLGSKHNICYYSCLNI